LARNPKEYSMTRLLVVINLAIVIAAIARGSVKPASEMPDHVGAQDVDPFPPPTVAGPVRMQWSFERDAGGWNAVNQCNVSLQEGALRIISNGEDPYLVVQLKNPVPGPLAVRIKLRSNGNGTGQFFWTSDRRPRWSEDQSNHFEIRHDGQWHEYSSVLPISGMLTGLRLDPGSAAGSCDVDWIELTEVREFPLVLERMENTPQSVKLHLRNPTEQAIEARFAGQTKTFAPGQTAELSRTLDGKAPFEAVDVAVEVQGFPSLRRTVVVHRPTATEGWIACRNDRLSVQVAPDGSGARIERGGKLCAVIAPLIMAGDSVRTLRPKEQNENSVRLVGDDVEVSLTLQGDQVDLAIQSQQPVEGPVVRPVGALEQGLFAGLEYLGKGERSSSKLDVETEDHLRFAPDPLKVTMPLMACVTDRAMVAMDWSDMELQPTFACPNFVDGMAGEHRMSLRGRKISASICVADGSVEDAVLWAVRRRGLPPLPAPPRDAKAQAELAMAAIRGPIAGQGGWGHCAEERYARQPFADVASTVFRLTGQPPRLEKLVPGGGHVRNDSIYFVTGRAEQWLKMRQGEARGHIAAQQPDGSYRYRGPFQRGHYEDTASGWCAMPAARLLEFAWMTGDRQALAAGLKTLDYMKRFRVPRGAQTWELSLHTPDVLASAYLVWAYVRGYELTGKAEYLEQAKRWALSGVPFVYQWQRYPIMLYATTPVYGATNYRSPLWIGLPVQWCGGVYAYALVLLAPHDNTLDWKQLARGILIAGQQMQYPDGPLVGCLPDVFRLTSQNREGPSINPSALASLQLALDGEVDNLAVASNPKHRIIAPFPVTLGEGRATVEAVKGLTYQVLIDGEVVEVGPSQGRDEIPLK
jgi:hypothetical protein